MTGIKLERRPSVARRIWVSYLVMLCVFSAAAAWSMWTFRRAGVEAELMREGYLPLAVSLSELSASQDIWNSQLNHVESARNPADLQVWFETTLRFGRPQRIEDLRGALAEALPEQDIETRGLKAELDAELLGVLRFMKQDAELVPQLFLALEQGQRERAQSLRDRLVRGGVQVQRALDILEERVKEIVDQLVQHTRQRERVAFVILVVLGVVTLLVGTLMALLSRRLLRPLSAIAQRAQAVAEGDLSTQPVIQSNDELGELSKTFEGMVDAISSAREQVLQTERLAAIGKMAAHVTHEVRNPLSSIALNLDLLHDELGANEEASFLLKAIEEEVERLSVLSTQYLSMARRRTPELQLVDLKGLIESALRFIGPELERHGIKVTPVLGSAERALLVDEAQIRQVIFNLLRNSREALTEGGHIWLHLEHKEKRLQLRVADNGAGVPPAEVAKLFDPFFTTKAHGTGLGLAVTKQIVEAHGGELSYGERIGGGASFTLSFPLA